VIIEFVGCPGAGKTYIADKLKEYVRLEFGDSVEVVDFPFLFQTILNLYSNKLLYLFKFVSLLVRPKIFFTVLPVLMLESDLRLKLFSTRIFLDTLICYEIIRSEQEQSTHDVRNVYILDEGYIQRLLAIHVTAANHPDMEAVKRYLGFDFGRLIRRDLVIYVESDVEVNYARLEERGWFEFVRKYNAAEKRGFLTNSKRTFDYVLESLDDMKCDVLYIDNTKFAENLRSLFKSRFSTFPFQGNSFDLASRRNSNAHDGSYAQK
jgi:thymidylate kinase